MVFLKLSIIQKVENIPDTKLHMNQVYRHFHNDLWKNVKWWLNTFDWDGQVLQDPTSRSEGQILTQVEPWAKKQETTSMWTTADLKMTWPYGLPSSTDSFSRKKLQQSLDPHTLSGFTAKTNSFKCSYFPHSVELWTTIWCGSGKL